MDTDQKGDSGRAGDSVCMRLRDMCLIYMGAFILGKAIKSTLICKEGTKAIFTRTSCCFIMNEYNSTM
jgi:hypothetical protein